MCMKGTVTVSLVNTNGEGRVRISCLSARETHRGIDLESNPQTVISIRKHGRSPEALRRDLVAALNRNLMNRGINTRSAPWRKNLNILRDPCCERRVFAVSSGEMKKLTQVGPELVI